MLKVVFNILRSLFSLVIGLFRPLRRLWCRRLRASEQDVGVPTIVNGQSLTIDMPQSFEGDGEQLDSGMESWDVWDTSHAQLPAHSDDKGQVLPSQYSAVAPTKSNVPPPQGPINNTRGHRSDITPEPDSEPDYFHDMQPEVKKAAKILVKKKDAGSVNMSAISSRLAVLGDTPPMASELQSWDEGDNSWADELSEDLSWEADAAIREKRRAERQERLIEQQRRKQQRDAMRGLKKDSSLAVKIS